VFAILSSSEEIGVEGVMAKYFLLGQFESLVELPCGSLDVIFDHIVIFVEMGQFLQNVSSLKILLSGSK
jgi:hypothetical protein